MGILPNYTREFAGEYTGTIFRDTRAGENSEKKRERERKKRKPKARQGGAGKRRVERGWRVRRVMMERESCFFAR